ncbi:MAG: ABC transporter ATP-binding protein [Spirochaetota bacterium]|nr:ABC transporter ATP-binding protein [Spirochaetota bacterium]
MEKRIIEIDKLIKIYRISDEVSVKALNGISLQMERSDFIAVMGASGSGKSTFMNILGLLDTPSSGKYMLDGIDVMTLSDDEMANIRNRKIGFVFQGFNLLSRASALENVEMPLLYRGVAISREMKNKAKELLALVGLAEREHHHPNKLSGGEQQRVAIARALINNPTIILADEPTGNLDTKNTEEIMNLFTMLNKEMQITIILVTHETDVARYANRKLVFKDGKIVQNRQIRRKAG